jgi:hypothetical protein
MSPELERILTALWERDTCEPAQRPKWDAILRRLVDDARSKQSGLTYDEFMQVIEPRYRDFRRARKKPSTLPPKA